MHLCVRTGHMSEALPINHCLPGMGVSTVSAARILRGQMEGGSGEETMLAMDTFPYVALSKVTIILFIHVLLDVIENCQRGMTLRFKRVLL